MGFKDVMKSFLYETVEDDELEEEEEVEVSAPQRSLPSFLKRNNTPAETPAPTPATPAVAAPAPAIQEATVTDANVISQPGLYVEPQVSAQPQSGQFLSAIEDVVEEKPKPSRTRQSRPQINRANRANVIRQDYSSIISPIYGDIKEEEKDTNMVHDAINLTKPVDASEMTAIISPIFGTREPNSSASGPVKVNHKNSDHKRKKAAPRKEVVTETEADPKETGSADLASYLSRPAGQTSKPASEDGQKTEQDA